MAGDRAGRKEQVTSYAKLTHMATFDFQPLHLAYGAQLPSVMYFRKGKARQGKFICIAQFSHKATQSALQEQTNYIKNLIKQTLKIAFKNK